MSGKNYRLINILAVDDESINILIYETLLSKHFNLVCASNATDALEAMKRQQFDLILMDINLGENSINGTQLMKLIRADHNSHNMKIFAVTAYFENRESFIEEGFDELYTKPVIKEEIMEVLESINRELD